MADNGIPEVRDLERHIGEEGSHTAGLKPLVAGVLDAIAEKAGKIYLGEAKSIQVVLSGGAGRTARRVESPVSYPRGKIGLYLPSPPCPAGGSGTAVTAVEVRNSTGGSWSALSASDWFQEGRTVYRANGVEWPAFPASVRVTYRAGYDGDSPMPGNVALGILDGAAAEWKQRTRAQPGLEGLVDPGSTPRMPKTFWMAVDAVRPPPEDF